MLSLTVEVGFRLVTSLSVFILAEELHVCLRIREGHVPGMIINKIVDSDKYVILLDYGISSAPRFYTTTYIVFPVFWEIWCREPDESSTLIRIVTAAGET
jgi:hypothetical protein